MFKKSGQDKINGAISMFTNAMDKLNEGIETSEKEIEKKNIKKQELSDEIKSISLGKDRAERIKVNIENLLA
jgi:hypothetical protein